MAAGLVCASALRKAAERRNSRLLRRAFYLYLSSQGLTRLAWIPLVCFDSLSKDQKSLGSGLTPNFGVYWIRNPQFTLLWQRGGGGLERKRRLQESEDREIGWREN